MALRSETTIFERRITMRIGFGLAALFVAIGIVAIGILATPLSSNPNKNIISETTQTKEQLISPVPTHITKQTKTAFKIYAGEAGENGW